MSSDDATQAEQKAESPAAPGPAVYLPGDVVAGKYELRRKAGEGGMGAVWVAQNTTLQIPVALKLLRGGARTGAAPERLLREARAAARLHHPSVVRVFDFGVTEKGDPFIVMELLDGESLRDRLEAEGVLTPPEAVRLLLPIVDGVSAAHGRGIIHRDLKPDNIFLSRNDTGRVHPKVVDFGVAKIIETGPRRVLTRTGTLVGSPEYMPPEQARGFEVDGRSDVWAMCVVLYELVSGRRPFIGENPQQVLMAIVEQEPENLVESQGLDHGLWAILSRGLAKDIDQRTGSMRELGEELARWLLGLGVSEDICGGSLRSTWLGLSSVPPPAPRASLADASRRPSGANPTPAAVVVAPAAPLLGPLPRPAWLALPAGRAAVAGATLLLSLSLLLAVALRPEENAEAPAPRPAAALDAAPRRGVEQARVARLFARELAAPEGGGADAGPQDAPPGGRKPGPRPQAREASHREHHAVLR